MRTVFCGAIVIAFSLGAMASDDVPANHFLKGLRNILGIETEQDQAARVTLENQASRKEQEALEILKAQQREKDQIENERLHAQNAKREKDYLASLEIHEGETAEVERVSRCNMVGYTYMMASFYRDTKRTPQQALVGLAGHNRLNLPTKKYIINTVYFEPAFAFSNGGALQYQMINLCLNGPPPRMVPLE